MLVFFLSSLIVLSVPLIFFRKSHRYCRSELYMASKHAAQHRVISSALALDIIKSLVAPNHGHIIPAPFTLCCILPGASVAGGVRRPRSGALVRTTMVTAHAKKRLPQKVAGVFAYILQHYAFVPEISPDGEKSSPFGVVKYCARK